MSGVQAFIGQHILYHGIDTIIKKRMEKEKLKEKNNLKKIIT